METWSDESQEELLKIDIWSKSFEEDEAVEMHGRTIGIDYQPGKGSGFWIKINDFQQV